jgi:hypothetical protein
MYANSGKLNGKRRARQDMCRYIATNSLYRVTTYNNGGIDGRHGRRALMWLLINIL